MKIKNKKATSLDFIYLIIFVVIIGLFIIMGKGVFDTINSDLQAGDILDSDSKDQLQDFNDRYVSIFDYMALFIMFGLYLFLLVSAYYLDTHPVYFILGIIFTIISFVLAGLLNNIFFDMVESNALSSTANQFTIIPFLMNNLLPILVFMAASVVIVMYAKSRA